MMDKIRLMLVDDHPLVLEGLKACLSHHPHIEIVGEASDGQKAVSMARELIPDMVLMDIRLPRMSGLEATRRLREAVPALKILVLTMYHDRQLIREVIKAGAHGYLLKDAPLEELMNAIEAIHRGESSFSQDIAKEMARVVAKPASIAGHQRGKELSVREREVMTLIANGLSSREIARDLGVSIRTIQTHREHIMKKLDIHTAAGLTKYALQEGIIFPE